MTRDAVPVRLTAAVTMAGVVLPAGRVTAQDGQAAAMFEEYCASCHGVSAGDNRAPDRDALGQQTPEAILDTLTTGSMNVNAQQLSADQRLVLAEFVAGRSMGSATSGDAAAMPNRCPSTPLVDPLQGPMWNGWGGSGQLALPTGSGCRADRHAGTTTQAQVGLWVPQCQLGVRPAHGCRRTRLHRRQRRSCVLARC